LDGSADFNGLYLTVVTSRPKDVQNTNRKSFVATPVHCQYTTVMTRSVRNYALASTYFATHCGNVGITVKPLLTGYHLSE